MLTGRRTKLAIAAAVLIVGTGTALLFRRDEATEMPTAEKPIAADHVSQSKGDAESHRPTGEAKLAGRIEPYAGWGDATASVGTETIQEVGATKNATGHPANSSASASESRSARDSSAVFAADGMEPSALVESPHAAQTASGNGSVGTGGLAEPTATLLERFAQSPHIPQQPASTKRHRIIDGDTLAAISQRYLGTENRYLDVFEYNRDVLTSPELLPIGKELRIPPSDFVRSIEPREDVPRTQMTAVVPLAAGPTPHVGADSSFFHHPPATSGSSSESYVVQPHDTLALIARKIYGDMGRQAELLAANRQQLRSAKDLRPGMTLVVPAPRNSK